jgi:CubicO group peptidase (beta-lactamase class C family)
MLRGIAVGRGLIELDDAVSAHIGPGWTHADAHDEASITIRHLMTMTSGLDDAMTVVAAPGTHWDYNLGAGYHTLKRVIAAVGGDDDLDTTTRRWLLDPVGMSESGWNARPLPDDLSDAERIYSCYPDGAALEGFTTTTRDLARFGLAVLAGGTWNGSELGLPPGFLATSLRPSTPLNPAYGLLWWVNGQEWQLAPKADAPIPGPLLPDAPDDTVAALGALGRALYVVPSRDLVVVRIGAGPGEDALAASRFGRHLWTLLASALPA